VVLDRNMVGFGEKQKGYYWMEYWNGKWVCSL